MKINIKYLKQFLIGIAPVYAKEIKTGVEIPGEGSSFSGYVGYISAVFSFALKLGAALTVVMVIYAGFKYMTSRGNPSATGEAKEIIIGTLSGFAMLLLIYLILNVLNIPTPS